jgi:hypothetical protein
MEASRKVEGGKFLKLVLEDGAITIVGDFFVHPEEAIEDVEAVVETELDAADGDVQAAAVRGALEEYVEAEGIDLVGITPEAIAKLAVEVAE